MRISFIGDINFRSFDKITEEQSKTILTEVNRELCNADFRVANLETPLTDKDKYEPIEKSGPNHIYSPACISFLNVLNTDVAVLANNHMGDYGDQALIDTARLLEDNHIKHIGAGENIFEAYKSVRLEKDGMTVSLIAVCENEFGLADENKCGTAAYRPRLLFQTICAEKKKCDRVVVIFHGGNEFNPLPSPDTVERYRMICDMGADALIAMHTHCPQGYENYNGKPIVYSMGNFMFQSAAERQENDSWYYGYLSHLDIGEYGIELAITPYRFDKTGRITVFKGAAKDRMTAHLRALSDIIQDMEELHKYFMGWCYDHRWFLTPPESYGDMKNKLSGQLNLIFCEAHLSMLKENYRLLNSGEESIAIEYSRKIKALSRMPI